jgi:Na+/melibiose symporter-like transporter
MLPFYLNAVINPQQYCRINKIPLNNKKCKADYYLGILLTIFFTCCIFSCTIWHYCVSKYGKIICWKLYSLISIIPFILFLFCDIGTTNLIIISAIFTSFPTGGAYLNDVLISDIIEYDEFSTGKRAEGIFTVFSSLIPKFVSLFAQAIPLSILSLIGFIPTQKGYVHVQPNIVIYYIKIVFAVIPIILSIVSFVFKNRYPIKEEYNILIKKGIEVQKMNFNIIKKTK